MPKNTWDNRRKLTETRVATYTEEQKHNATINSIMSHYAVEDESFQNDWQSLMDTDPEAKEVRVLVVGDAAMRSLTDLIAATNRLNPGALKVAVADDAEA